MREYVQSVEPEHVCLHLLCVDVALWFLFLVNVVNRWETVFKPPPWNPEMLTAVAPAVHGRCNHHQAPGIYQEAK